MPKLTTHVLDLTSGKPAAGMRVRLTRGASPVRDTSTNADGRCDSPLAASPDMPPGPYQIEFFVRDYFESRGIPCPFLDVVPISFTVSEGESYHVPLLCSPWSYSTYRGS